MASKRIVVIGASAGGLDALRVVAAALPADFPAAVCIVLHTAADSPGILDQILDRSSPLPARTARTGERLQDGRIYVAPPDCHLIVEPGVLRLSKGPKENRFRPAIDPLFRSAAAVFGPAAIGVILTGNLDDGMAGLWAIKRLGGIAIVQDPDEAPYPAMPRNALDNVDVDYRVGLAALGPLLDRLARVPPHEREEIAMPDHLDIEVKIAREENALEAGVRRLGDPSWFACPECHGVLIRLDQEERPRFRCHTGHAYSVDSLLAAIGESTEDALWTAIRALQEAGMLMQQLSGELRAKGDEQRAEDLAAHSIEAQRRADVIRQFAAHREAPAARR